MNAVEFVKKYGLDYAKHILSDDAPLVMDLDYSELKSLVESWELVMEHGSIERAREYANSPYTAPEIKCVLLKAIADVEKCQ